MEDELNLSGTEIRRIADIESVGWPMRSIFPDPNGTALEGVAARFPNAVLSQESNLNLSFNSFLIRTPHFCGLIDCGVGNHKTRLDRPAWHRREGNFIARLRASGIEVTDIDLVINTHLHADHVGWNTTLAGDGWKPTFPNARYVVPREELDFWREKYRSDPQILHGAFHDSVQPILAEGLYSPVELPCEVAPNLWLEAAPGHTLGLAVVRFVTPEREVVFLSDVLHTPLQFALPMISSKFCFDPDQASRTRIKFLDECAERGAIVAAYHFPRPVFGRVNKAGEGYEFGPVV
ncbi:MBL fold metallo-hydrolase [Pseudorhodoplanes sp.]|uniref:MBL fold metallo-hydrolase n=1 Tax=Pseudorhodoplanes sp. TaxID=1934341 RepID=UPI003D130F63